MWVDSELLNEVRNNRYQETLPLQSIYDAQDVNHHDGDRQDHYEGTSNAPENANDRRQDHVDDPEADKAHHLDNQQHQTVFGVPLDLLILPLYEQRNERQQSEV